MTTSKVKNDLLLIASGGGCTDVRYARFLKASLGSANLAYLYLCYEMVLDNLVTCKDKIKIS
ncbi:MAG: hypothetical protein A2W11_11425 [Ignavibacteria bacterium RBG_16_35_7]|nr:MAG: hypothetical protein A2W11_11425 [Ignavibacteria bacterium RBG_16_35_7]